MYVECRSDRMPLMNATRSSRKQRGASLIEVMVAVLILGIGMLGMAALQSMTLKNSASSAGRTQAVIQTYSVLDALRIDRVQAAAGRYNVASWSCAAQTATQGQNKDYSVFNNWLAGVQATLGDPNACGKVDCGTDLYSHPVCTVGIRWNDSRATGGKVVADETFVVETRSRL